MKVIIETPNFNAKDGLITFVEEQIKKLKQFSNSILDAHVVLKTEKAGNKENKFCEIKMLLPGNDLFASKHCDTFESAVLQTIEALRHQMEKKKRNRKRGLRAITG